ncbi:MAG: ZIP family metal transporter [Chromatiales bacterium]|nr:ZIP family metal transporter [Chromatiales bacterium]
MEHLHSDHFELLTLVVIFSLLGGVLSVLAASLFLLVPDHWRERMLPHLVSFAIGALLAAAFLALLPHAINFSEGDVHDITFTVLLGLMAFFLLEKMVLWRHCHSTSCEAHTPEAALEEHHHHHHHSDGKGSTGAMVLIGDGLHNFVDGVLIAAAFLVDTHLGIVTALAVAAHEIPQEVGDFAILLHSGFSRARAFAYNIIASLATLVGALLAFYSLDEAQHLLPYVLAIAASSFIYIAVADLIPGLHKRSQLTATTQQMVLIALGIGVIYLAHSTLH